MLIGLRLFQFECFCLSTIERNFQRIKGTCITSQFFIRLFVFSLSLSFFSFSSFSCSLFQVAIKIFWILSLWIGIRKKFLNVYHLLTTWTSTCFIRIHAWPHGKSKIIFLFIYFLNLCFIDFGIKFVWFASLVMSSRSNWPLIVKMNISPAI